jgi:hypothetical protein
MGSVLAGQAQRFAARVCSGYNFVEISSAHLFPVGCSDECSGEEENDGYLKGASRSPGQCREASELSCRNRHKRVPGIGPPGSFTGNRDLDSDGMVV